MSLLRRKEKPMAQKEEEIHFYIPTIQPTGETAKPITDPSEQKEREECLAMLERLAERNTRLREK